MSYALLPITTYIQEDLLKKEYLHGLQQRRLDEKFSYIGERQAQSWFNRCESPDYEYYRSSKQLLEDCISDFVRDHTSDVNVIALGPGDALKEKIVVDSLLKKHQVDLFFVDTSREILDVAVENTADSGIVKEVFIADLRRFMDIKALSRHVKKHYHSTNFFTLLGNTLGNYPQAVILKTIRNAMTPGDKILIDVNVKSAGSPEEEAEQVAKMIQAYSNASDLERISALLSEANIEETDGNLEVEYTRDDYFPQMQVIKQFFHFNRSKTITYEGEDIYFTKGERILVCISNKYTFESLENILTSHGLRIIKYAKDATGKYYQLLCELA